MKILLNAIISTLLAVSLSGCIIVDRDNWRDSDSSWEKRQSDNKKIISKLEINDSRESVVSQLGAPDFSEAYTKGDKQYRILFYRTTHEHSDGDTTKDETTPLVFLNDSLVGWGQDALNLSR
ncbi:MAG: hypothetical protein ACJAS9_000153 [Polaribacter sp.]|jgi:hypothetical protein